MPIVLHSRTFPNVTMQRKELPEAPPARQAPTHERTAVCFSGLDTQRAHDGGKNIRANLVNPLGADVLLAFTQLDAPVKDWWYYNCTTNPLFRDCKTSRERLLRYFYNLQPVAAVQLSPTTSTGDLVRRLEATAFWDEIVQNMAWGNCERTGPTPHVGNDSPYRCTRLSDYQNTYFGPILGTGPVLKEFESQAGCLRLLRKQEEWSGFKYDRVVFSRIDFLWLKPHPPLSLLHPQHIWVPMGETYGGVNDRHAVMSRDVAEVYFGRFDLIMNGRVRDVEPFLLRNRSHGMSSERLLAHVLRFQNITVAKFPSVAYLQCCRGRSACHAHHCNRVSMPTEQGRTRMWYGKYKTEMYSALISAMLLDVPGAAYAAPIFSFEKNMTLILVAVPRKMATSIDCNMSTVGPELRHRHLPASVARYVGPALGTKALRYTWRWDFPCPRQLLLSQIGQRALSLPLVNESQAPEYRGLLPYSWVTWQSWKYAITSGGLSAAHEANGFDGYYLPPTTCDQMKQWTREANSVHYVPCRSEK